MAKITKQPTDGMPSREEARALFDPALAHGIDELRSHLARLRDDPPSVLIFESGSTSERTSLALWYAALLNCEDLKDGEPCLMCPNCLQIAIRMYANLSVLDPIAGSVIAGRPVEVTGKTTAVSIENVRELRSVIANVPHGEGYRVNLLLEAQTLNTSCANALLKIMEEPYPRVRFVITAPSRGRLLPTLVSRGWTLTLPWPNPEKRSEEVYPAMEAMARFLENGTKWFSVTSGKGANAITTDSANKILVAIQKELLLGMSGKSDDKTPSGIFARLSPIGKSWAYDVLSQAQTSLTYNVNPGLVLDWMAIKLYTVVRRHSNGAK